MTLSWALARNPSTPVDILEEMSRQEEYGVRSALANNRSINDAAVNALARDPNPSIRVMLTYNPATSEEVLRTLTRDSDAKVRRYATLYLDRRVAARRAEGQQLMRENRVKR
jgi:hypothetical protein